MVQMPYLKLAANYFTVYFKLAGNNTDPEWIDSTIEIKAENASYVNSGALWYYQEPEILLSDLDDFIMGREIKEPLALMDSPWWRFEFDRDNDEMRLKYFFGTSLTDHLTLYFERQQLMYLDCYLKLFLGQLSKEAPEIQRMYAEGVLQGD